MPELLLVPDLRVGNGKQGVSGLAAGLLQVEIVLGSVGLFGYFVGDAICSKIFVGSVANSMGWNAANLTVAIGAGIGVVLCAMLIKSEKKATE